MQAGAIGLVLAGGRSRRMGQDKRQLLVDGERWVERAVRLLRRHCPRGFVSVGAGEPESEIGGWPILDDPPPAGRGPLVGIHAGLRRAAGLDLCVLACDYPLMDDALLGRICDTPLEADVRLARDEAGRDHPLVARWSAALVDEVGRAVAAGELRVRSLLEGLTVERVDGGRALTNVNDPDQLERLGERA